MGGGCREGEEQAHVRIRRQLGDYRWTLLPDHPPQGQLPTCDAFFPRFSAENMEMKTCHIHRRNKNPSPINLGLPSLDFTTSTPRPQEAGFKKNFISSTYRGQEFPRTKATSQRESHLTSGTMRKQSRLESQSQGNGVRTTLA